MELGYRDRLLVGREDVLTLTQKVQEEVKLYQSQNETVGPISRQEVIIE